MASVAQPTSTTKMSARVAARTDRPMRCVNRLGASVRKGDFATLISDYSTWNVVIARCT